MKTKTIFSLILLAGATGLTWMLTKKYKKCSNQLDEIGKDVGDELMKQVSPTIAEEKKKRTVVDPVKLDATTFSDAETLLIAVSEKVLSHDNYYSDHEIFKAVIDTFGKNCESFSWYSKCPKSQDEFVDKLREIGMYEKYELILNKIYQ